MLGTLLTGTETGLTAAPTPFLPAALVLLAVRYRAGGQLRHQVKWLALIAVAFVVAQHEQLLARLISTTM